MLLEAKISRILPAKIMNII